MKISPRFAAIFVALSLAATSRAVVVGVAGGTGAPAATLGGYNMTAFPLDARLPLGATVNNVPSPLGGVVGFSTPLEHDRIGNGWATWSHTYTGDVYDLSGLTSLTLTLPANTGAFYFYAEPNNLTSYIITATDSTGALAVQPVVGNAGAAQFGFYGVGSLITSITVTLPAEADGFAVGEFGIALGVSGVPDGGVTLPLFGVALLGLMALRRRLG